ncbi:MAG TPA: ABC transporter permease [Thermomicrobiales bacterium]|nr:ABC transporter permease [Thermomicrobiales bacterium]
MSSISRHSPQTRLDAAADDAGNGTVTTRRGRRRSWVRPLLANPVTALCLAFVVLAIVVGILAPWIATDDPNFATPADRLQGPSADHLLGTDALGRDVFSRLVYGARISLLIGIGVTFAAGLLGAVLGLLSGYLDRLDSPIMRFMDGLMAFPSILLAIAIMASLGPSTVNVFIALTVVYTPTIARLVRSTTLVIRQQTYIESARSIGLRDTEIMGKYIFPNGLSPLIVQCTFVVALAIISESSLSFLGAGVPPDQPTWGNMLRDGQSLLQQAWWLAVFPGTALFLLVLALNIVGDGLRDTFDPRSQRR